MKRILQKFSGLSSRAQNEEIEEELDDLSEEENEEIKELSETEEQSESEWLEDDFEEGQLSIDVFQDPKSLIIKSTIAGVKPEDIDISINNDMLTIRGKREMQEEINEENYLYRECYWGSFSRSIILPVEIEADKIDASLENGVLTVVLPKAKNAQQISIKVKGS
jgi:HSP20 family protein